MAAWCPRCGAEYVEGWGTCSGCGVELVAEPPPARERTFSAEDAVFTQPSSAREDDDPFVPIWEGPWARGSAMARRLEDEAIPVDLGDTDEPGVVRVEVPRSYTDEALGVLADIPDGWLAADAPLLDDPRDADEDWEPGGWSPGTRLVVLAVAVVLIVALLVTSRL